ncbi:MAG: hypothetical protein PVJ19_18205 [Desulfobacteraceae bacterium]|jgi:hypothetical protein
MNDSIELVIDLYAISGGFWLLFCLYSIFSIKKFIVKRYESETKLMDTIFFREHFTFYKYQPDFFSSGLYTAHLLMCVWAWWFYGKRKIFRDIANPEIVTRHFTNKEICRVKRVGIIGGICLLHVFGILFFKSIWPEVF